MPDLRATWVVLGRNYLALWFLFADAWYVVPASAKAIAGFEPGSDAILYASAAHAWLGGLDPWRVTEQGVGFGAPPPTLILFAPFADMPPAVTAVFWLAADLAAVAFVIRSLHLKWWWVIFPPVLQAILPANPEPIVLAFLLAARPGVQGIAPILKIYALAPLLGERNWRAISFTVILLLATFVILPWGQYIADLPMVSATLAQQGTGLSAFSVPLLLPVGVIALVSLGLRRAGWLAVPVLWPSSQIHYATTALPEMTPILAVGFSLPIAGAPPVAVAIQAAVERWRAHRTGRSPADASDASVP